MHTTSVFSHLSFFKFVIWFVAKMYNMRDRVLKQWRWFYGPLTLWTKTQNLSNPENQTRERRVSPADKGAVGFFRWLPGVFRWPSLMRCKLSWNYTFKSQLILSWTASGSLGRNTHIRAHTHTHTHTLTRGGHFSYKAAQKMSFWGIWKIPPPQTVAVFLAAHKTRWKTMLRVAKWRKNMIPITPTVSRKVSSLKTNTNNKR